jgi:hypothetical protein
MARSLEDVPPEFRRTLVAGVDWGGGRSRTVVVIGYMDRQFRFVVVRFERFQPQEEPDRVLTQVAQLCGAFDVHILAADGGGNGQVYNRLLVERLGPRPCGLDAILYSSSEHEPQQDGVLTRWTVNRSASLGALFGRVKKQTLHFPPVADCGSYLDDFGCEFAEYDDEMRTIRYSHPESQPDDSLHAANYALLMSVRASPARSLPPVQRPAQGSGAWCEPCSKSCASARSLRGTWSLAWTSLAEQSC